ncbi:MAG: CHAT domain-containing protein, partial [Candidatus Binatia bacterium]
VKKYRGFFEGISRYAQLAAFDPRIGKDLYTLLFKDFAPLLKAKDTLIIIPDEILGILPFEVLVTEVPDTVETAAGKYGPYPQGVKYLGDAYPISYSQSATAFTVARTLKSPEKGKNEKLLVVADPVFDLADARLEGGRILVARRGEYQMGLMRAVEDYRGGKAGAKLTFSRLENTGHLLTQLQRAYGQGVDTLSGLAASETELRQRALQQYGSLIFATHGILDNQVPYIQEPALVLSQVGVNSTEREQDGFLTMSEVMGLKLNAEVAALTACNTGVGKNLTGEGVMGMGRAFQYAGAKTVLMSLWSVEEESTTLLTEKFFTYVHEGKGKLDALRQARADVRKAGYEHPFFWAPFIVVGER